MKENSRRHHSPADKVRILRLHLLEGKPISQICEAEGIHPTMFYQWQKTFFEKGSAAFENRQSSSLAASLQEQKLVTLENKLRRKDEVIAEIMEDLVRTKKKSWGELKDQWVPHDLRDTVIDFLKHYSPLTEITMTHFLTWMELSPRKFHHWKNRYGKANEHNAMIPRDHWIEPHERSAIVKFATEYPLEGYRRLTFMMLDKDVAAVSPSTTYRVLKAAGLIGNRHLPPSSKGQGFVQPLAPHDHWHIDFSYINLGGTFYYLCSVLDGCSRAILAWDIRPQMKESDAEIVLQRAREAHPNARPRIISDNGPQFIAKDFKEFIRLWQTSHVLCSPHYPQSNGKLERFHRTLKEQAIRPKTPLTLDDAKRVVADFIVHYNSTRLHSAIGYVTPNVRLANRHNEIFKARDKKLEDARQSRKLKRQQQPALVA